MVAASETRKTTTERCSSDRSMARPMADPVLGRVGEIRRAFRFLPFSALQRQSINDYGGWPTLDLHDGAFHFRSDSHILFAIYHVCNDSASDWPPAFFWNRIFPDAPSNAKRLPSKSPVKTTPPAVGVIAATIGREERYFHRIFPLSASTAVNQPVLPVGSSPWESRRWSALFARSHCA